MPKTCAPFYEPMPAYMQRLLMMGARFVAGNTNQGTASTNTQDPPEKPETETPTKESEQGTESSKNGEFKSEESKQALLADLKKERDQRKQFQTDLSERDTQIDTLNESVTERDTTIAERDARITEQATEISVLRLALDHGITDQEDLDLLTDVTDTEKREKLAERLAKQANTSSVVSKSGHGSGETTGGTVDAGRDLYKSRKK